MNKVLITTSSFGKYDSSVLNTLKEKGYEVKLNPYKRRLKEQELLELISDLNPVGMIAGVEPITAKVIERATNLKVISRCGIGTDNIDKTAAKEKNIVIKNTPDGPTQAVAELILAYITALSRNLLMVDSSIRNSKWERPMGRLLSEHTLGLIGCGRIGSRVARLMAPMGVNIIGCDPCVKEHKIIKLIDKDRLIKKADIISLHIPHTQKNHHFVNSDFLNKMKKGTYIINASRGGIVDENALHSALKSKHLAGACLDTYEREPYNGRLKELPNVILTPHIGSYARGARIEMEKDSALNLLSVLTKGEN